MRKHLLRALAVGFLISLSGAVACDNKGGMAGCGGAGQETECPSGQRWNGTHCAPK